jgi:hypothetical protein
MTGKCEELERIGVKALVVKLRGTSRYLGGWAKGTTKMSGKHSPSRDSNWTISEGMSRALQLHHTAQCSCSL